MSTPNSLGDLIFSGVFERHPRLRVAIVEFELAWAPDPLWPALAKAGDRRLPSDFFRRTVVLSFQEDAIGIRLRDVIGAPTTRCGLGLSAQRVDVPRSRKILAGILAGVPVDEQAKPAPDHNPGIAGGNTARVYNFDVARLTAPA
jgi:hypothetical protein